MRAGGGALPTQLMQGGWQAGGGTKGGRGKQTWGWGLASSPSTPASPGAPRKRRQPQKSLGETFDLSWISPLNPSPCP